MTPCESCPARLAATTCRMTISASSGDVPAATNNARPISFRRSAGIFGILVPPLNCPRPRPSPTKRSALGPPSPALRERVPSAARRVRALGRLFPSMGRAEIGRVDFQPVKASRIVKEDLALQFDRYVIAVSQGGNGIRELTVPVRIVRGEQDVVLGEKVRDIAQGLLFRLAGYEHP